VVHFKLPSFCSRAGTANSVQQLPIGWTVRGSNPGRGEIFHTHPDWPGAHPASYTMGTGSFPGVKWPGCGIDHPPPPSIKVKERVELYLYCTSGPLQPVIWWTLQCKTLCFRVPSSKHPRTQYKQWTSTDDQSWDVKLNFISFRLGNTLNNDISIQATQCIKPIKLRLMTIEWNIINSLL